MSQSDPPGSQTGQYIMVTGVSSGIGRATATRLADAGHVVFAAAPQAGKLEALAAEHPGVRAVALDVTDAVSIDGTRERSRTRPLVKVSTCW